MMQRLSGPVRALVAGHFTPPQLREIAALRRVGHLDPERVTARRTRCPDGGVVTLTDESVSLTSWEPIDLVVRSDALKREMEEATERKARAGRSSAPGRPSEKDVTDRPHLSRAPQSRDLAGAAAGVDA